MPPKRPSPLSDAALVKREGSQRAAEHSAALSRISKAPGQQAADLLGETNAGLPLPVKNTFIDVPSGSAHSPTGKDTLKTAPAQVNCAPGFVQRAVIASASLPPIVTDEAVTSAATSVASLLAMAGDVSATAGSTVPETPSEQAFGTQVDSGLGSGHARTAQQQPASPKKGGAPGAVQRPGVPGQDWPTMTPSPTGANTFSAARYQLFGGPAPVQEATYSAMAPVGVLQPGSVLATSGAPCAQGRPAPQPLLQSPGSNNARAPAQQQFLKPLQSPLLSYGASTFAQHAVPVRENQAVAPKYGVAAGVQPTSPLMTGLVQPSGGVRSPPTAFLNRNEQQEDSNGEDMSGDSDDNGQQQQNGRSPEDAPKPPPGALHPSIGSENHGEGTCKRCCFFPRNRCNNGYDCDFCHYEHEKRKRKNKKSKKKGKDGTSEGGGILVGSNGTGPSSDSLEVWSTSYGGGVAQVRQETIPWSDPLYQYPHIPPPVVYEQAESPHKWTYQWIDDPRQPYPPQYSDVPTNNYYGPATGLQSVGTQPLGVEAAMPANLPPVQPIYTQPPIAYTGQLVGRTHYRDLGPDIAMNPWGADSAWQPPFPAPAYPAMTTDTAHASGLELASPSTATAIFGQSNFAPPPMDVLRFENVPLNNGGSTSAIMAPPPPAPLVPPTVEITEKDGTQPPPPSSSPKLSTNFLMTLQQESPPVPGDPPI